MRAANRPLLAALPFQYARERYPINPPDEANVPGLRRSGQWDCRISAASPRHLGNGRPDAGPVQRRRPLLFGIQLCEAVIAGTVDAQCVGFARVRIHAKYTVLGNRNEFDSRGPEIPLRQCPLGNFG